MKTSSLKDIFVESFKILFLIVFGFAIGFILDLVGIIVYKHYSNGETNTGLLYTIILVELYFFSLFVSINYKVLNITSAEQGALNIGYIASQVVLFRFAVELIRPDIQIEVEEEIKHNRRITKELRDEGKKNDKKG